MDDVAQGVLPYRTEAADLARWVEALARGRTREQVRSAGFSAKGFEGTAVAAAAFGFYDPAAGELTARGRAYALAAGEARERLLREALAGYPPYGRLLEAVRRRGSGGPTDAQWIETWWATQGYGSSQSNRMEGVAVFGKMVEALGLARFVPGRRGHATRVEWLQGAPLEQLGAPVPADAPAARREAPEARPAVAPPAAERPAPARPPAPVPAVAIPGAQAKLRLELGEWGAADLSVPARLPAGEKRRLIALLEVLIQEA